MLPRPFAVLVWLGAALTAQSPGIDAVALPTRVEACVYGVPPGAPIVLVLGLTPRRTVLPGGLVMGVAPDVVGGLTSAAADGVAVLSLPLQPKVCAGLQCFAQAIAWPSTSPPVATPVQPLRVPERGAEAPVYVLFGQSNAEGHAPVEGLPLELGRPMPRSRAWNLAHRTFEPLAAGVNGRTLTTADWFGPELTLLRSLAANGNTAYLVKVAVDQTALGPTPGPLDEWGVDAGRLYPLLLSVIAAASADLRAQGLTPRVRGVLMMQGESDATSAVWAAGYANALRSLVQQLRIDLGAEVPFVIGRIAAGLPAKVFPFVATVRAAQLAIAAELPACATVETSGLSVLPDQTHFDTAGQMALGLAFAAELQRLRRRL